MSIFAVVGPSGAGKDTLMAAAKAARPEVHLTRRVVTRAAATGEDYRPVTEDSFRQLRADGAFALSWSAHGLSYGIPREAAERAARGETVLFNGSRAMLGAAAAAFPGLRVLHVTATEEVLRARLTARGRESASQIEGRLARANLPLPEGLDVTTIDNSGALEEAVAQLLAALDLKETTP
ncbi:phosphonate metabolism protein/1,5-bisphosphokinase (PRPP-forming) PhnN [Vannielia litorea]|uniref:phosphonate metabolism protein/1,5-bisphosphokinase (PRPP-forming) PhnN n=1 Tax=Vannielia litorea TaxID=1217970 RepID=UPI001C9852CA|nr:phosphonate metabolism protein/1,5-bisphosphokinase (PRPP-forming) PhnN [Vannielia litorea]MBY6151605.1 phosphonate metabolism protein/1,5-bisphosphokinase (PRPP-forming) PhnN [Vannielia litorea]